MLWLHPMIQGRQVIASQNILVSPEQNWVDPAKDCLSQKACTFIWGDAHPTNIDSRVGIDTF
jgi:hypothetical protein